MGGNERETQRGEPQRERHEEINKVKESDTTTKKEHIPREKERGIKIERHTKGTTHAKRHTQRETHQKRERPKERGTQKERE